jgi:glycosyltransferase involved in cell wall biosynthesis
MKIGIDIRKLHDFGIGTHIRNVILDAIRLDTGNEYILFGRPEDRGSEDSSLNWIPESSAKYSIMEHISLSRHARSAGLDLYHAPHYTLPMLLRCPSIVTIHDLIHFKFREYFPAWKVKAAEIVIRSAVERAQVIVTVSETSRSDIEAFLPKAAEKIQVIYNRLDEAWFAAAPGVDLSAMGIGRDYLLYTGNFKKHKGIETLIQAYSTLRDPPPLVLAGKTGAMDSELNDRILSLPRVRLLGFADRPLLHQLYAQAMLLVMPSLYEGFGYPPLEAMAVGIPVLSSDAPALREVLAEGVEFFDRGSAESLKAKLEMLMQSATRRKELSAAGRNRARVFATDAPLRKMLEIYRRFSK